MRMFLSKHLLWKMLRFSLKYGVSASILGSEEPLFGVAPWTASRRSATTGRCSYTVPAETPRRGIL